MNPIYPAKAPPSIASCYPIDKNPTNAHTGVITTTPSVPSNYVVSPVFQSITPDTAHRPIANERAWLDGTAVKLGPDHGQYKTINTAALPNDPILKDFYIRFRYTSKLGVVGEWSRLYQFKRFHVKGN